MATIKFNPITREFRGTIGDLVFRQVGDRIIVSGKPSPPKTQTVLQKENRSKFRHASAWAKGMMLDAKKKAYYQRKAKKLSLPNAYTAALKDYLNKGEALLRS